MGRVKTKTLDAVGDRVDNNSLKPLFTGNGGTVGKYSLMIYVYGIRTHLNFKLTSNIRRRSKLDGIQVFHGYPITAQIDAVLGVLVRTISKLIAEGCADGRIIFMRSADEFGRQQGKSLLAVLSVGARLALVTVAPAFLQ